MCGKALVRLFYLNSADILLFAGFSFRHLFVVANPNLKLARTAVRPELIGFFAEPGGQRLYVRRRIPGLVVNDVKCRKTHASPGLGRKRVGALRASCSSLRADQLTRNLLQSFRQILDRVFLYNPVHRSRTV